MRPWVKVDLILGFCKFIGAAFFWPFIVDEEIILKKFFKVFTLDVFWINSWVWFCKY